jgi:hypothetical protein
MKGNVRFMRISRWVTAFSPSYFLKKGGIIVDDICPMKKTISKHESNQKGKVLVNLLQKIDCKTEKKKQILFCHKG